MGLAKNGEDNFGQKIDFRVLTLRIWAEYDLVCDIISCALCCFNLLNKQEEDLQWD